MPFQNDDDDDKALSIKSITNYMWAKLIGYRWVPSPSSSLSSLYRRRQKEILCWCVEYQWEKSRERSTCSWFYFKHRIDYQNIDWDLNVMPRGQALCDPIWYPKMAKIFVIFGRYSTSDKWINAASRKAFVMKKLLIRGIIEHQHESHIHPST